MPLNCRVCSQSVGYVVGTTTFGRVSATRFTEFVLNEVGSATRITEFVLYEAESAVSLRDSFASPMFCTVCRFTASRSNAMASTRKWILYLGYLAEDSGPCTASCSFSSSTSLS